MKFCESFRLAIVQQRLEPMLKSENWIERKKAVEGLGIVRDLSMDIIDYLEPALRDTNSEIKEAAATAILLINKRQRFNGFFQA
ncbi:HEAT repeat domain-containing protein [Microcoleus sp. A2-C5]|uniref:HEAT repeat domain-containing protein n=1 Tax=unclassified Microcoleus TaxID=2642155 RepID=UPI002FD6FB13